jgi:hypothetical protein
MRKGGLLICTSLVRHKGGIFNEVHKEAEVGMDPSILEWHATQVSARYSLKKEISRHG